MLFFRQGYDYAAAIQFYSARLLNDGFGVGGVTFNLNEAEAFAAPIRPADNSHTGRMKTMLFKDSL